MKKLIFAALFGFFPSFSYASFMELEANFGIMTEFDEPRLIDGGGYPNFLNTLADYRASCESPYETCSGAFRYFGLRFALTDTFMWNDGGYIYEFDNELPGSFYINVHAGGGTYSYFVEDTGDRWLFGSFYNTDPTPEPFDQINFTLTTEDGESGIFIFDKNRTGFFAGNSPLAFVPEPETFALFLLGAVGLCVRRQIKANATQPV